MRTQYASAVGGRFPAATVPQGTHFGFVYTNANPVGVSLIEVVVSCMIRLSKQARMGQSRTPTLVIQTHTYNVQGWRGPWFYAAERR